MIIKPRLKRKITNVDDLKIGQVYLFKFHKGKTIGQIEAVFGNKIIFNGFDMEDGSKNSSGLMFDDPRLEVYEFEFP